MRLGDAATTLYLGDAAIGRAYLGEQLVYSSAPTPVSLTVRAETAVDASTLVLLPSFEYWGGPDNEPIYWHAVASTNTMYTALRFALPSAIPAGATILNARLTVHALGSATGLGHIDDRGQVYLVPDRAPAPISDTNEFYDLTVYLAGGIQWSYGPTAAGGAFESPSLATLVQGLVDGGSVSGLMFIVQDNPNPASIQAQDVNAANSAHTPENRPYLYLEYTTGDAPPAEESHLITDWTAPTVTAGVNSKAGYRFSALSTLVVSELGLFAAPSATSNEVIELWEVGGAMLASVTLTPVPDEWVYAPITPVTLQASQSYALSRHRVGGVGRMVYIDPPSIDWSPLIDNVRVIYGSASGGEPATTFEPPDASWAQGYYAVNARFIEEE